MSVEQAQLEIQTKLAEARKLLIEVSKLAEENGVRDVSFMGLIHETSFGWFTPNGELQEPSEWNSSACVIGSHVADGADSWNSSGCTGW